jgi:hypothetical protein
MYPNRELSDVSVIEQARQLKAYSAKGGAVSAWLDSKEFLPADRAAILAQFFRADEADMEEAAS